MPVAAALIATSLALADPLTLKWAKVALAVGKEQSRRQSAFNFVQFGSSADVSQANISRSFLSNMADSSESDTAYDVNICSKTAIYLWT
jgi:fructose/tagatose bisphosphate aldolase